MARAPKGKAGTAASPRASAAAPAAKRRKKKPGASADVPGMRRSASASSSASSSGGAGSPKGDGAATVAAAAAPGSGASTPSARECEQCGNCVVLEGVAAARAWPTAGKKGSAASTGCQICDFVAFRKAQRPCVQCGRAGCDHFCDWCGHGFHAKCAKLRGEDVSGPDGFCCRKCEAEQENPGETSASEDDGEPGDADELGARCGSCRLPFNGAAPVSKDDKAAGAAGTAGFRVNQSVLVDNEDMLYNAVITAVDAKGERIKIHFIRWSKSFDDWYAMDDERINESLACDCCNQWFHIGCLPPIKSSGRWKDSTYVCPACIDDARAFHNGSRAVLKAKAAYISTSIAIASSSSSSKGRKRADKDADDRDADDKAPAKRKRKLSEASAAGSPLKRRDAAPAPGPPKRAASVSSSPAPDTTETDAVAADADATAAVVVDDAPSEPPPVEKPAGEAEEKEEESAADDSPATDAPAASAATETRAAAAEEAQASPEPAAEKPSAEAPISPPKPAEAKKIPESPNKPASPPPTASSEQAPAKAEAAAVETHRRRGSGHSMSSLLNSPAPEEERPQAPFKPTVTSLPMLIPHRPSPETIKRMVAAALPPPAGELPVKLERDLFPSRGKSAAKKEPAARSRAGTKKSARGSSLSAFDILREVATQSMGGEVTDAPAKPKRERSSPAPAANEAAKRAKADAATSTSSPAAGHGAPSSEAERLAHATRERMQMNSFVDLHFNIRKEMYLRFCRLEEEGLLARDAAHLLRALIYPTSDKFQDLKFVYLVNKDLPSDQLTKRLLEVVPLPAGGKGPAAQLAAALLPPPPGHHAVPHRVAGPPLSSMALFSAGVNRNVSPAGTPRMGLLPHGASLSDRLAESAIRSPLRSAVASGPAPIPGSIKSPSAAGAASAAPRKRPELVPMERTAPARAPPASVPPPSHAGPQLISR